MIKKATKILSVFFVTVLVLLGNPANSFAQNCTSDPTVCVAPLVCRPFSVGSSISTCQSPATPAPAGRVCNSPIDGACDPATEVCNMTTRRCQPRVAAPVPGTGGTGVDIGTAFGTNFVGRTTSATLGDFVSSLLPQIYTMALLLVLIYLVWGSFKYLVSGGDPKAVQAARAHLTWAVVGMIFIFISYGLFQLINSALGSIY